MKRSIVIPTFVLVCFLALTAVAYGIREKISAGSESLMVLIMILSIGPGLAVIAGVRRKRKRANNKTQTR